MAIASSKGKWAEQEFSNIDLGDLRLNKRLIQIAESFSESPESPINQACETWAETKAAYRFFQNDSVNVDALLKSHAERVGIANYLDTIVKFRSKKRKALSG